MTREEAILTLKYQHEYGQMESDVHEALGMAIKELEQEPCEDYISRAEAIRIASGYCHWSNIPDELAKLPPVQPKAKVGHWIKVIDEINSLGNKTWHHECSVCGNEDSGWGNYKYCPNCGAKMEEDE